MKADFSTLLLALHPYPFLLRCADDIESHEDGAMYVVSTISILIPHRPKGAFERLEAKYAPASDNLYLVAASICRFFKEAICVLYLMYLYRFFFQVWDRSLLCSKPSYCAPRTFCAKPAVR